MKIKIIPKRGPRKGQHIGTMIIDKDQLHLISVSSLWVTNHGYAMMRKEGKHISVHRLIIAAKCGEVVDHVNRNKLDNRRSNLRIATHSNNSKNQNKHKANTSGYIGVHRMLKGKKMFMARVCDNSKRVYLGSFHTAFGAAFARDLAARELYGEYAVFNFPGFEKKTE